MTDGVEGTLIDAGLGPGTAQILENIRGDGIDPGIVKRVALTHAHADHGGGCAAMKRALGVEIYAPKGTRAWLENADEDAINLTRAKAAGGYARDYKLEPVEVAAELDDGDALPAGGLVLEVMRMPGHTNEHNCYLLRTDGKTGLFSGDFVFWQGKILLLYTQDCSIWDYGQSMDRLRGFGLDRLFPGHGAVALTDAQSHVDAALAAFDTLGLPPVRFA